MKKVFTNADDVIHLFAQQTQDEARSSNVFFYGTKLYSYGYHYLLAEFIDSNAVLINDKGYSATTAKHISIVSYATRQYKRFFVTETDLDYVQREVKSLLDKLAKARKPENYINKILGLWESLNEYLKYTKSLSKSKKDDRYKYIKKAVDKINVDWSEYRENLLAAKKKAEEAEATRVKLGLKEKLEKFYNYEIDTFRVGNEDFLRLSLDMNEVETSQGVKVSVQEARMLYLSIVRGDEIRGTRIGDYEVISVNGTLKIGCHNINMDSVHRVGKVLIK